MSDLTMPPPSYESVMGVPAARKHLNLFFRSTPRPHTPSAPNYNEIATVPVLPRPPNPVTEQHYSTCGPYYSPNRPPTPQLNTGRRQDTGLDKIKVFVILIVFLSCLASSVFLVVQLKHFWG